MRNTTNLFAAGMGLVVAVVFANLAVAQGTTPVTTAPTPDPKPVVGADGFLCMTNIPYGPDPNNILDLWLAKSDKPTPLVIFIHGGGFFGGDKGGMDGTAKHYAHAGVSFASINYRLTQKAIYPSPMLDCARAVQYLRYKAADWNLDAKRIACTGSSAGAGISLWIAFHKDLADPKSDDPVTRQSTRVTCVAVQNAQASYDPRFLKEHIPGNGYTDGCLPQLFGIKSNEIFNPPPDKATLMEDSSPINHLTADAPPVMLVYGHMALADKDKSGDIHHVMMGILLKEKLDAFKVECVLVTKSPTSALPRDRVSTGAEKTDYDFILRQFAMGHKNSRGRWSSDMNVNDCCCILNAGGGSWAFAPLADHLSRALWVDVAHEPRRFNYLLLADDAIAQGPHDFFIPFANLELAADKRSLARVFAERFVPTPETHLVPSLDEAQYIVATKPDTSWCLKFPTGCGASGHRLLATGTTVPDDWPRPFVVQEFVRMERPEVYRLYAAGGETFGWVVRRFPLGVKPSPWVAPARGARYEPPGDPPAAAVVAARAALEATGLLASFGCADLLRRPTGEWVVLEVGTDGMFNHVDRDLGLPELEREIQRRIADAFWQRLGKWRPWGGTWHPRPLAAA